MKNYFKLAVLTTAIMSQSQLKAEYLIIYQLDPNGIIMQENAINGEAQLNSATINRGESTTLSWNYQYANSVNIKGLGIYGRSGSVTLNPLASKNYEIEVLKGTQKKTENLFLTVIQPNQNIEFNSDKLRVGLGDPITLNWNVENAEYVDIDNGVGNRLNLVGNSIVYPTLDTTFRLTAKGYEGIEDSNSYLTIDVVNDSVINSFNSSSTNITKGNSITFNWDVTDSEGVILSPYGNVNGIPTGQQVVNFDNAGYYDFTLRTLSLSGREVVSTPIGINVYNPAVINSYTINGETSTIDVSPNEMMNIDWATTDALSLKLNGNTVNGTSATLSAPSSVGTTNYVLEALNGAGDSVNSAISVNVIGLPVLNTFTGPNTVFSNSPLTLSWTGTGISKYEIKSNNVTSGIATTAVALGSSLNTNTTPTAAGTYTYTLSGYNTANAKFDLTKSVVVEADPTFSGFTVNGQNSISVSPNTALTFAGAGFSTGAALQGRNSGNTANATLPTLAPATGGTYTYYAAATKTLNSISKYSTVRSVTVLVENWIATTPNYTSWVNSGGIYGCSNWSPDPSTVNSGVSFTQTANDCEQDQTRNRQNREQESTTLAIRNSGSVIVENQTLTSQINTRSATGTKVNKVCLFDMSFSPNTYEWYNFSGGSSFWMSQYQTIPGMWIDVNTGMTVDLGFGGAETVPGLTKISNLEFRYNDGNKIWKITRGTFNHTESGNSYYQICFE